MPYLCTLWKSLHPTSSRVQFNIIWYGLMRYFSKVIRIVCIIYPLLILLLLIILAQCLPSSCLEIEKYFLFYNMACFWVQSQLRIFYVFFLHLWMKGSSGHHKFYKRQSEILISFFLSWKVCTTTCILTIENCTC